ncbi:hypothetical protein Xcel_3108 [Xylanimonas cellulosilytica DSM 15894]|uniref:Uncharacterized protein n=1 Tax=Xylanimonas cellulosilytica (strain DSM 15894 / JCM 12276 / CECT 5975 / KCTC 9989 / LMG 20990 / NBRC 107835 / XIL07) TaxID=446471 RepID=D1BZY1_XYLCX|nr:hypothetical protein [Xylanimonas cellulosilytica]ACZ32109.1 hypothetical protein Xcel_3108 [Xylanimonas cellulosilytica DSM 15894]
MTVPDGVCWDMTDEPSRTRLVTHVRLPLLPWPARLPAPMPASWVGFVLLATFLVWFLAFVAVLSHGHPFWLAPLVAAVPAWLLGRCVAPIARVRLRREAFSVLRWLREEPQAE